MSAPEFDAAVERAARERLSEAQELWLFHEATDDILAGYGAHMGQMLYRLPSDSQTRDMKVSIESLIADLKASLDALSEARAALAAEGERAWDNGAATALNFARREPDGITLRLDKPNPYRIARAAKEVVAQEPDCKCGGMAACLQCQERDAETAKRARTAKEGDQ